MGANHDVFLGSYSPAVHSLSRVAFIPKVRKWRANVPGASAMGNLHCIYFDTSIQHPRRSHYVGRVSVSGMSPEAYLEQIRTNLNDDIDTSVSEFEGYRGMTGEWIRWTSGSPLGTVLSIDFNAPGGIEFGSVVSIVNASNRWVFATAQTPVDDDHPVSGNRRFGFTRNGSQITFYTRGVDRISTTYHRLASLIADIPGGTGFERADTLWSSLMESIQAELKQSNGGQDVVAVSDAVIYRPDWNEIEKLYDDDPNNDAAVLNSLECE